MRIVINSLEPRTTGSARIHVHNMGYFLKENGCDVVVNDWNNYTKYDVAIFGKSVDLVAISNAHHRNPLIVVGKINPSDYGKVREKDNTGLVDFFIAGSIEERDYYLADQKPIAIFPQIERFNLPLKVHNEKPSIVIGYHGNKMHIEGISTALLSALERINKEFHIEIRLLYDIESLGLVSFPSRLPCKHIQWSLKYFGNIIQEFDIGIVPSLTKMPKLFVKSIHKLPCKSGFKNDYIQRFKNTTNAGRAFVFFQLGIPVVAEMVTSHFHILGNPENGMIALSEEGWYQGIKVLAESAETRNRIGRNAKAEFDRLYNPMVWARQLGRFMENLLIQKKEMP